jgi:hypothetical protein
MREKLRSLKCQRHVSASEALQVIAHGDPETPQTDCIP